MAVILGIDPGSYVTGFGVIKVHSQGQGAWAMQHLAHGVITLSKKADLAARLHELAEGMQTILQRHQPVQVSIEKIFLGRNADSAFKLGHARGVIMACAVQSGAEVHEHATRLVKKAVAGSGAADKLQVQQMVMHLLRLSKIDHLDASDALALALYQAQCTAVDRAMIQQQHGKECR